MNFRIQHISISVVNKFAQIANMLMHRCPSYNADISAQKFRDVEDGDGRSWSDEIECVFWKNVCGTQHREDEIYSQWHCWLLLDEVTVPELLVRLECCRLGNVCIQIEWYAATSRHHRQRQIGSISIRCTDMIVVARCCSSRPVRWFQDNNRYYRLQSHRTK